MANYTSTYTGAQMDASDAVAIAVGASRGIPVSDGSDNITHLRTLKIGASVDQGDNSISGTLAWHITNAAGSNVTVRALTGSYDLTTSTTIPVTMELKPEMGAVFDGSGTLTINSSFSPGRYQVFDNDFAVEGLSFAYPEWFGSDNDVSTPVDDGPEFNVAFAAISSKAGNVIIDAKAQHYIATDVTIPEGCGLIGELIFRDNREGSELATMGSVIYLNGSNTINLNQSAAIQGLGIIRYGIVLPADATEVGNFTGTAITLASAGAIGAHGTFISRMNIIGFTYAIDSGSNWTEQGRIEYVNGDCTNGIRIYNSTDLWTVSDCNFWPAASIDLGGVGDSDKQRNGIAYIIRESNDWTKFINCFSYGYDYGFFILDSHSVEILACGTDYTVTMSGTPEGIHIEGNYPTSSGSADTIIIGFQAAGQSSGIVTNTSNPEASIQVIGSTFWDLDANGINIADGDAVIIGNKFRDMAIGISASTANTGTVIVNGNLFKDITSSVYANHASYSLSGWNIGEENSYIGTINAFANANFDVPTVASASTIVVPKGHKLVKISGTTGITSVTATYAGHKVSLLFAGTLTVTDGSNLKLGGHFSATADDILTLICDGTNWYQEGNN